MDRAELSEALIQELGAVFMAAVQEAAPELLSTDLGGIERRLQAMSRQLWRPMSISLRLAYSSERKALISSVDRGSGCVADLGSPSLGRVMPSEKGAMSGQRKRPRRQ